MFKKEENKLEEVVITREQFKKLKQKLSLKTKPRNEKDAEMMNDPLMLMMTMMMRIELLEELEAELFGKGEN